MVGYKKYVYIKIKRMKQTTRTDREVITDTCTC